jgi:hypothetical protein
MDKKEYWLVDSRKKTKKSNPHKINSMFPTPAANVVLSVVQCNPTLHRLSSSTRLTMSLSQALRGSASEPRMDEMLVLSCPRLLKGARPESMGLVVGVMGLAPCLLQHMPVRHACSRVEADVAGPYSWAIWPQKDILWAE